jgi:hypothetical protein
MTGAITYRIDAKDRIVEVGGAWKDFAYANGGNPDPSAVIGRPLWDFVRDEGTREVYRLIVLEARRRRTPIHIPFRCDSAEIERHMTMTIAPDEHDEVLFICKLRHSCKLTLPQIVNGDARPMMVVECERCYRIHTRHGWKPCWDAVVSGDVEIDNRPIKIRRDSCYDCLEDRQQLPFRLQAPHKKTSTVHFRASSAGPER